MSAAEGPRPVPVSPRFESRSVATPPTVHFRSRRVTHLVRYVFYVARAITRRVLPYSCADTDVVVVSPGGVATTMLIAHIGRYRSVNDEGDEDGLKHRRRPPRRCREGTRFVFVTGDFHPMTASLNRRRYLHSQASKLGAVAYFFRNDEGRRQAFRAAVEHQRTAWMAHDRVFEIEDRSLWLKSEELATFLGLSSTDFVSTFPQYVPRLSSPGDHVWSEPPWRSDRLGDPWWIDERS